MDPKQIAGVIRRSLDEQGLSPFRAAIDARLPENAIRTVLSGHEPKLGRLAEICDALGLELYVGPPRGDDTVRYGGRPPAVVRRLERSVRDLVRLAADLGGHPIPDDLWSALVTQRGVMRPRAQAQEEPAAGVAGTDALAVSAANEDDLPPGARAMTAREVEVAAGGGAVALDEAPEKGRVFFRRDWLDRHGIDTTQCVVIGVRGESMEPTLPDGCSILVDRARTRRRDGGIFVIDTEDGLIVKRLGKTGRRWLLVSDHPSWEPAPWPREAEVIGEVRWASRTFG